MKITKRQLRRIIEEETIRLMEQPDIPDIMGAMGGGKFQPREEPVHAGWDDEEGDDDWRWEPEQRQYQEYEKWARDSGHVTPAASSVIATYFVEQGLTHDKEHIDTIAAGYRIDPQDVMRDIERQQAESAPPLDPDRLQYAMDPEPMSTPSSRARLKTESSMRITKRQLKRIIKEEKRCLLSEASIAIPQEEVDRAVLQIFHSDGQVMMVDVYDRLRMDGYTDEDIDRVFEDISMLKGRR